MPAKKTDQRTRRAKPAGNPPPSQAGEFVIQRTSETRCEWWTESGWTENEEIAARFTEEPHAGEVTGDESAKAVRIERTGSLGGRSSAEF
jgi:hypothetical protein